ncbi:unnamed protein product, partial [Vitis vinifera]
MSTNGTLEGRNPPPKFCSHIICNIFLIFKFKFYCPELSFFSIKRFPHCLDCVFRHLEHPMKRRSQANAVAQQALIAHWQSIVKSLNYYLKIMKANHVPPFVVCKVFTQIFSFINVQLFNSLLLRRECCSFSNGEFVKTGLAELENWCHEATEEVISSMRVMMTEDSNNAVSSSFLLDDDSSIPFTVDDISKTMQQIEVSDIDPPPLIRENSGFSFLLLRVE